MTIPLPITVVFFTLEQMGDFDDVVALDFELLADMFIPGMDPLMAVVEVALLATGLAEASARDTAPNIRTAAVASEMAPVHQARPAGPMAAHRPPARCLRSPMPTLLVVSPPRGIAPTCVEPARRRG